MSRSLGISVDEDGSDEVKAWVEERGVTYPILMGDDGLAREYGALGFPALAVVSSRGRNRGSPHGCGGLGGAGGGAGPRGCGALSAMRDTRPLSDAPRRERRALRRASLVTGKGSSSPAGSSADVQQNARWPSCSRGFVAVLLALALSAAVVSGVEARTRFDQGSSKSPPMSWFITLETRPT